MLSLTRLSKCFPEFQRGWVGDLDCELPHSVSVHQLASRGEGLLDFWKFADPNFATIFQGPSQGRIKDLDLSLMPGKVLSHIGCPTSNV
jgi:hypothetical protein